MITSLRSHRAISPLRVPPPSPVCGLTGGLTSSEGSMTASAFGLPEGRTTRRGVPRLSARPLLAISPILLALGCTVARSTPERVPRLGAEGDLLQRVASYYQDFSARNWPAYREYFWPLASLTTVWQPPGEPHPRVVLTTIEDFITQTAQGPDSKPIFEERLLSHEVRVVGDLAQVWARYEARFGDSGSVATWRGIDAFTWMRHDGVWRIVSLAYSDEPAEQRGAQ